MREPFLLLHALASCDPSDAWPCGFGPCEDATAADVEEPVPHAGEGVVGCQMIAAHRGVGYVDTIGWLEPIEGVSESIVHIPTRDVTYLANAAAWNLLGLEPGDAAWLWGADLPVYAPAGVDAGWIAVPIDYASGWKLEYATPDYEMAARDFDLAFTVNDEIAVLALDMPENLGGLVVYRDGGTAKIVGRANGTGHHAAAIPVDHPEAGPQPVLLASTGWIPLGGSCVFAVADDG